MGTETYSVHPDLVARSLEGCRLPPYSEVYSPDEFAVDQVYSDPLLGDDVTLDGCEWSAHVVCAEHPRHRQIAQVLSKLNHLVGAAGVSTARSGDLLVMFEVSALAGQSASARQRLFGLVSMVSYSPRFTVLSMCTPVGGAGLDEERLQYPFDIEIALVPSCLLRAYGMGDALGIDHCVDDEVIMRALSLGNHVQLHWCSYELLSVARMRVTGVCEMAEEPKPRASSDLLAAAVALHTPGSGRGSAGSSSGRSGQQGSRGRGRTAAGGGDGRGRGGGRAAQAAAGSLVEVCGRWVGSSMEASSSQG